MGYWLIITIILSYAATSAVVPHTYASEAACQAAGRAAVKGKDGLFSSFSFLCVPAE